ncbi:hypothetical protein KM043_018545 [Ampulex compressa]|nr:hypothetical protein KM043_018545 [Ampulex compressa]
MMGVLLKLHSVENVRHEKGLQMLPEDKFDIVGKRWMSKIGLEKKLHENISDVDYNNFLLLLKAITNHPASNAMSSEILQYCETRRNMSDILLPPFEYDEMGKPFIKVESTYTLIMLNSCTKKSLITD